MFSNERYGVNLGGKGDGGTGRIRGRGNNNQNILYEKKNLVSIQGRIILSILRK